MNEQGKNFVKGKKRTRVLAVALLLAILVGCLAAVTAMAGSVPSGTFTVAHPVEDPREDGSYRYYDWSEMFSTSDAVSLYGNEVFRVTDAQGLAKIRLVIGSSYCADLSEHRNNLSTSPVAVRVIGIGTTGIAVEEQSGSTVVSYTSSGSITMAEANDFLNGITLSFNKGYVGTNGSASISLTGYNNELGGGTDQDDKYLIGMIGYNCQVNFYNYAEGEIDKDSLFVTYENEDPSLTTVDPADENKGEVSFNVKVTAGDVSANIEGMNEVTVGYAIKQADETWTEDNEAADPNREHTDLTPEQIKTLQDEGSVTVPVHITGLNANTEYEIKGLIVTGGKTKSPKQTASVTASYVKPSFSSFSVSGSDTACLGGVAKRVSAEVDFLNHNYDGKHTPVFGQEDVAEENKEYLDNASLSLELFFTDNLTQKDGKDTSTWTKVEIDRPIVNLTGESRRAILRSEDGSAGVVHTLPAKADSQKCAYRLVVTDRATGYKTYSFTKPFSVDSNPPTSPTVQSGTEGVENKELEDGTAVNGDKITLEVGKSSDTTSGVASYAYAMYYINSDNTAAFMQKYSPTTTGVIQPDQVLKVLKSKVMGTDYFTAEGQPIKDESGKEKHFTDSLVEYTDWTNLEKPEDETKFTSFSIAKDGFYVVLVRASDKVDLVSKPASAMMRIDLSVPNPPTVRLATLKSGKTAPTSAAQVADSMEAYDGRFYSDKEVWLFTKAVPQTGKTIDLDGYQYSLDGGKSWLNCKDETTFLKGPGTVKQVYNPLDYTAGKADYAFDIGFKLRDADTTGYQTVLVKAKDTLNNVSLPSEKVERRQEKNKIDTTGTLNLTNLEIALALGNTDVDVDNITPTLKNKVAQKVNVQYFGAPTNTSVTDPKAAGFNPINLLYSGGKIHECTFMGNPDVCDYAAAGNCPYENDDYDYFKPNMVNVQGIAGASAGGSSKFTWTRYDHTYHGSQFATVFFDPSQNIKNADGTVKSYVMHTNPGIDTSKATYWTKPSDEGGEMRYTATTDYVVPLGQINQVNSLAAIDSTMAGNGTRDTSKNSIIDKSAAGDPVHFWESRTSTNNTENGVEIPAQAWDETSLSSVGKYVPYVCNYASWKNIGSSGVSKRIYHMVDMSNSKIINGTAAEGSTIKRTWGGQTRRYLEGDMSDPEKLDMSTLYGLGYASFGARDWMFMYYDQPTKKTLSFTIDDKNVFPHANDFYGFLFNTTIRQNINGDWVLSGYVFLIGSKAIAGQNVANDMSKYNWYIVKLTDMNLDWFANSTGDTNGIYWGTGKPTFMGHDELMYNKIRQIMDNASHPKWTKTWGPADSPVTSEVDVLAYTTKDVAGVNVRNFRLELSSDSTAKLYVWNTGTTAKTLEELTDQYQNHDNVPVPGSTTFVKDSQVHNANSGAAAQAGYRIVTWKTKDGSTPYDSGLKDKDGKPLGPTVLYVPRPTVDGYTVGDLSDLTVGQTLEDRPHSDANCFGFGPIVGSRGSNHGCTADSLVIFSNVSLEVNVAKKLSDVLSMPNWGAGKAFYVLNVSNDSVSDYTNPILSAKIQNRMSKDNTRLITLADIRNSETTTQFNEVVLGEDSMGNPKGFYQLCGNKNINFDTQMENIADYITTTYFAEYGLKTDGSESITAQINKQAGVKGRVYSLADAEKMTFGVEPIKLADGTVLDYNTRTANEDYPSGRWYLVHDTTGYQNVTKNPLSEQYSDGLNLKITAPGRYSLYFAPDKENLNPDDDNCIFDFIVNQSPEAQFVAALDPNTAPAEGGTITINDYSTDPDTAKTTNDTQFTGDAYAGGTRQITGISGANWEWKMNLQYLDPSGNPDLNRVITVASGNSADYLKANPGANKLNPYNGITLKKLLQSGKFSRSALAELSMVKNKNGTRKYPDPTGYTAPTDATQLQNQINDTTTTLTGLYYTKLLDDSVITFFETVEDVSTRRVRKDGKWVFTDPAENGLHSQSKVAQQDMISSSMAVVVAPSPLFNADITEVYDTNDASKTNITFTRSTISSDGSNFNMRMVMNIEGTDYKLFGGTASGETAANQSPGGSVNVPNSAYYTQYDFEASAEKGSPVYTNNIGNHTHWYLRDAADKTKAITNSKGVAWPVNKAVLVPADAPQAPSCSGGKATGKWKMTKEFVEWATAGKADGTVTLILWETTTGIPIGSTDNKIERVEDKKGVTINFRRDRIAPSTPAVSMGVQFRNTSGGWSDDPAGYNASGYLDAALAYTATATKKIVINLEGSQDNQGKVAGYGFYFYDYKADGKTVNHIWKLKNNNDNDADYGKRIEVTLTSAEAQGKTEAEKLRLKIRKAVGVDHVDPATGAITPIAGATSDGKGYIAGTTGKIEITSNTIIEKPTDNLNVAIFAFDAQHITDSSEVNTLLVQNPDNVTYANETARSKVEGIKLASFTPYPPDIRGVNALGAQVAHINNDGKADPSVRANSNVTFNFTPKQGWFDVSGANANNPVHLPSYTGPADANHVQYYMDTSGAADLTNKAEIVYTLSKKNSAGNYVAMTGHENKTIQATQPVSINEDGSFKLSARVKNGSNAYSKEQSVTFEIDKTAPVLHNGDVKLIDRDTGLAYDTNSWAKAVELQISGGTDNNPTTAKYVYSLDNGANTDFSVNLANAVTGINIGDLKGTGTHVVRVYIEDEAGNRSETFTASVKIDREPPNMYPPTLTPGADTTMSFKDYVVTIANTQNGKVQAWDGTAADEQNTDVVVSLHGSQQFLITPDDGYRLSAVACGTNAYTLTDKAGAAISDLSQITNSNPAILTIQDVKEDVTLSVVFEAVGQKKAPMRASYMAGARVALLSVERDRAVLAGQSVPRAVASTVEFYNYTDLADRHGLVTQSPSGAVQPNTEVTFTVKPDTGYTLERVEQSTDTTNWTDVNFEPAGNNVFTFKITPDGSVENILYRITYKSVTTYKLSISAGEHGEIGVTRGAEKQSDGSYNFFSGDEIVLGFNADANYQTDELTLDGETIDLNGSNTYTIPAAKTVKNLSVKVTFKAGTGVQTNTIYLDYPTGAASGIESVEPAGEWDSRKNAYKVAVPTGGDWTIKITPMEHWEVSATLDRLDDSTGDLVLVTEPVELTPTADGAYTYTFTNVVNNYNTLHITAKEKKYTVKYSVESESVSSTDVGGTVTATATGGQVESKTGSITIKEGYGIDFVATPNEGWTLKSVQVKKSSESSYTDLGCRRNFSLQGITEDQEVRVVFEERVFSSADSNLYITALATNISDGHQNLHPTETYQFRLSKDGKVIAYSGWQTSATYTFDHLEPNQNYRVTVQAKDASGTVYTMSDADADLTTDSKAKNDSSEVYTLANMPTALQVETVDEENVSDKTVTMTVDGGGNPSNTKYHVFYSRYSDMSNRQDAKLEYTDEDGVKHTDTWAPLNTLNQLIIKELPAGQYYYMQVIARNEEGRMTSANSRNVKGIQLSRAAPSQNSMYFEEQEGPGKQILLTWDKYSGVGVTGYEVYRDGRLITKLGEDETSYVDSAATINGDGLYEYSYAVVTSTGSSTRCTAVSKEYYDAAKNDPTKQTALDTLAKNSNAGDKTYQKAMTYPTYPTATQRFSAVPVGDSTSNFTGHAEYRIISSGAERDQKYVVTLKAYRVVEENGKETRKPLTDEEWEANRYSAFIEGGITDEKTAELLELAKTYPDVEGSFGSADTAAKLTALLNDTTNASYADAKAYASKLLVESLTVETKSPNSSGAMATWSGLDINLEYKAVVKKVLSTGKYTLKEAGSSTVVDGYKGSIDGIEGSLGKTCYVDAEGYGYTFTNAQAGALLAQVNKKWGEASFAAMEQDGITDAEAQELIDLAKAADGNVTGFIGINNEIAVKAVLQDLKDDQSSQQAKEYSVKLLGPSERLAYTGGVEWGTPFGVFIAFNKSPNLKLDDNFLSENDLTVSGKAEIELNGKKGLLLDQSGDMKFSIGLKAWDEDGTLETNGYFEIAGLLAGQTGRVDGKYISVLNAKGDLPADTDTVATKEADAKTYQVKFDGSKFTSTGIYGMGIEGTEDEKAAKKMELSISDGGSKPSIKEEIPIVINKTKPGISVTVKKSDGTTGNLVGAKKIENGRVYGTEAESVINVASTIATPGSVSVDEMRVIRLLVMSNEFQTQFGANTVQGIMDKLNAKDATAVASAKKWMGDAAYAAAGTFDETETKALIDLVTPEVNAYFEITKDEYDNLAATAPESVREARSKYWVEKEYAFEHDLCKFLKKVKTGADAGKIQVDAQEIGVYGILLTSSFGGNETISSMNLNVVETPRAEVQSEKYWEWTEDVPEDEYNAYSTGDFRTVEAFYDKYKAEHSVEPWVEHKDDARYAQSHASYEMSTAGGVTTYSVLKLKDRKLDIGTTRIGLTLDISTGIYDKFENLTAMFYKLEGGATAPEAPTSMEQLTDWSLIPGNVKAELADAVITGTKGYTVYNLNNGATYQIWICYETTDPDTGERIFHCNEDQRRVTLDKDYGAAYYSLSSSSETIYETDGPADTDQYLTVRVVRTYTSGKDSYATLVTSIKYYEAKEDGSYVLDDDGQPKELTGEALEKAKRSLHLGANMEKIAFEGGDKESSGVTKDLTIVWTNTTEQQGHMIAKVEVAIDPATSHGYNYLSDANKDLTIFMQDDESPITFYKGELLAEENKTLTPMKESDIPTVSQQGIAKPMPGHFYDFSFEDLEYPYSSGEIGALDVKLKNTEGGAALQHIQLEVFEDNNGKPSDTTSSKFVLSALPSPDTLDAIISAEDVSASMRSEMTVIPSSDLPDGVHTAWLKLSWDGVKDADVIWIRVHQVVGQSTLQGYIYLTADKPQTNSTSFMGWSTVRVKSTDGAFDRTVHTDAYGYYRIPNIINGKAYTITVSRPGFITYNPNGRIWRPGDESATHELSFQLVGGDIYGQNNTPDNVINESDYYEFDKYYNQAYDPTIYDPNKENALEIPANVLELMKRDYNADGVVNALDRMTIYANMGSNANVYFQSGSMIVPVKLDQ